ADLPRPRRFHDRVDDALDVAVVDDHLDLDLRHEVHLVLRAAVDLGMSSLAAEPFDVGRRQPADADLAQRVLDVIDPVRLHDGGDQLHAPELTPADATGGARTTSGSGRSCASAARPPPTPNKRLRYTSQTTINRLITSAPTRNTVTLRDSSRISNGRRPAVATTVRYSAHRRSCHSPIASTSSSTAYARLVPINTSRAPSRRATIRWRPVTRKPCDAPWVELAATPLSASRNRRATSWSGPMLSRSSSASTKSAPKSATWMIRSNAMIRRTIASRNSSPRRGRMICDKGGSVPEDGSSGRGTSSQQSQRKHRANRRPSGRSTPTP